MTGKDGLNYNGNSGRNTSMNKNNEGQDALMFSSMSKDLNNGVDASYSEDDPQNQSMFKHYKSKSGLSHNYPM